MTFVIDNMASEIKREPTKEEKELVNKQEKLQAELYGKYIRLYSGRKLQGIDAGLRDKLWDRYLKEYKIYQELWKKYIGYCY